MTAALRDVAREVCGGRIVLATEGGYHLQALTASIEAALEALTSTPILLLHKRRNALSSPGAAGSLRLHAWGRGSRI